MPPEEIEERHQAWSLAACGVLYNGLARTATGIIRWKIPVQAVRLWQHQASGNLL